jgi:hypothetical protein
MPMLSGTGFKFESGAEIFEVGFNFHGTDRILATRRPYSLVDDTKEYDQPLHPPDAVE